MNMSWYGPMFPSKANLVPSGDQETDPIASNSGIDIFSTSVL